MQARCRRDAGEIQARFRRSSPTQRLRSAYAAPTQRASSASQELWPLLAGVCVWCAGACWCAGVWCVLVRALVVLSDVCRAARGSGEVDASKMCARAWVLARALPYYYTTTWQRNGSGHAVQRKRSERSHERSCGPELRDDRERRPRTASFIVASRVES